MRSREIGGRGTHPCHKSCKRAIPPRRARGVHVPELPLIGCELAVGVHVPFSQEYCELLFGEVRINARVRYHVKSEVPGSEPRVFPFVRHRKNILREDMEPLRISPEYPASRRWHL